MGKIIQITPDCWLEGNRNLHVITKDGETVYELKRVTPTDLFNLRKAGKPGFVLKFGEELFYTKVFWGIHLNFAHTDLGEHLCGKCNRCSALEDEFGGCKKVRDCSVENYRRTGNSEYDALELSKRIEKYDFIKFGYEAFNVKTEVLSISECSNFTQNVPKRSMDLAEKLRLQYSLEKLYHTI